MSPKRSVSSGNRLLRNLPQDEYQRLLPELEPVSLDFKQVLGEPRATMPYAYFPDQGVVSVVDQMDDGTIIEVATVGCEGMIGLAVLFGADSMRSKVFVQVAGRGVRMRATVLKEEAGRNSALRRVLLLYSMAFLTQVSQAVACNGLHKLRQRCCRWLLMTQDRFNSEKLPLTHELLAIMLGVRRSSVTEVLQVLQDEGLIRYSRGKIAILDRTGLESAACECYRIVNGEFDRLLGTGFTR
jgi:CRP-like cAMP-binding protein